jgi:hypothetical protein
MCDIGRRSAEEECSAVVESAFVNVRPQYFCRILYIYLALQNTANVSGINESVIITDALRSGD